MTRFITNFAVGQRSLSYDLFRPAEFDRCDDPIPDVVCRAQWSVVNDFMFTVATHRPVSYTLRFSDPAAVLKPASWAMLIAGFGVIGGMMRRRMQIQVA